MRKTPLKRHTDIRKRSAKREAVAEERRAFVAEFLAEHPVCQIAWLHCNGASRDVHESLRRSAGGEIVPGPKADAQGQTFWAVCGRCHSELTNPSSLEKQVEAMDKGWIQSRFNRA